MSNYMNLQNEKTETIDICQEFGEQRIIILLTMKPLFMFKYFLFTSFLISIIHSSSATTLSFKETKKDDVFITLPGTGISLSITDYIKLKPSDFKKLKGQKLTLKELIAFKMTQKKIKKAVRKDGTVDIVELQQKPKERFKWHWGGFFLGLFLPVIGIVISLFIKDDEKRNKMTSASISTLAVMTVGMIILIINLSNNL